VKGSLPVAQVRAACPRYNGQLAMQQLDLARLTGNAKRLLAERAVPSGQVPPGILLAADEADDSYVPDKRDDRKVIARQIRERRGQRRFRQQLRSRFADRCLVTGCSIVELLEACHINPHRGDKDNQPSNGLLLRTDIHTLFDLDLLGIEPGTLRLHLHPTLVGSEYKEFSGRSLSCDPKLLSKKALAERWEAFQLNCSRGGTSRRAG
jgi:putative restriction endonuclease